MFFQALIENSFLQTALWAGLLASIASGIIGSFVVVKRIAFIGGSISHSILGGMGLCLWLQRVHGIEWADPILGAFGASLVSAWVIGWIHLNYRQREDSVIAVIWSIGMAIGVIFITLTPGTNVELMNFLFGNILWVSSKDLLLLAGLDIAILCLVAFYYRKLLALCFDEEQARLQGVAVKKIYLLLLSLVALSIVLLTQVIGTILVITLLTIPATTAALFTNRLSILMTIASCLTAFFCFFGLGASYELNWPPGATIALIAAIFYLSALAYKKRKIAYA
ncbi:MAG: metal ABC transporter permease [Chlamydiales bacterium]|nr:metal ABC transporter permease [Chlamydiales bacterium]